MNGPSSVCYFFKDIPLIIVNIIFLEKFNVLLPESLLFVVLFLVLNIVVYPVDMAAAV